MIIRNSKVYDILKYVSRYFLPGIAVLYVSLAETWSLPYPMQISATIAALIVFINTLLGISNENIKQEQKDND